MSALADMPHRGVRSTASRPPSVFSSSDAVPGPTRKVQVELTDRDIGRGIVIGAAFGIPVVFGIVFAVGVLGGVSMGTAALVALLPTVVGSWFFGGLFVLARKFESVSRAATEPVSRQQAP